MTSVQSSDVQSSDGCVVTVRFDIRPTDLPAFLAAVKQNAVQSVQAEPGCRRFDVLTPAGGPDGSVLLYEIYRDRAAFDDHLASPHYHAFARATADMVLAKAVGLYDLTENARP